MHTYVHAYSHEDFSPLCIFFSALTSTCVCIHACVCMQANNENHVYHRYVFICGIYMCACMVYVCIDTFMHAYTRTFIRSTRGAKTLSVWA